MQITTHVLSACGPLYHVHVYTSNPYNPGPEASLLCTAAQALTCSFSQPPASLLGLLLQGTSTAARSSASLCCLPSASAKADIDRAS